MRETLISIIIPIYNVEKYLEECLNSVINQSFDNIEILCINDGSTDGSGQIIRKYADVDNRIICVDKTNSGYGNTMNVGIRKAKGKYIGIVESDDFVDKDMFKKLYMCAKETDAEVIRANYWKHTDVEGDVFCELQRDVIYDTLLYSKNFPSVLWSPPFVWTGIYKKRFLLDNEIFFNETPGASFQDVGFMFKVLATTRRLFYIKEAFYHYRCDNEFASTKSVSKKRCVYDEFESINDYIERHDLYDDLKYYVPIAHFRRSYETFLKCRLEERIYEVEPLIDSMKKYEDMGYIKNEYWSDEEFGKYKNIETEAVRYYWRYQFGYSLANQGDVYICGAGVVADYIYQYMKACHIEIKGFMVGNESRAKDSLYDLPVIRFENAQIDPTNCCVIIATKIRYQRILYIKLREKGYKKIYMMTYPLGDELGIDYRKLALE